MRDFKEVQKTQGAKPKNAKQQGHKTPPAQNNKPKGKTTPVNKPNQKKKRKAMDSEDCSPSNNSFESVPGTPPEQLTRNLEFGANSVQDTPDPTPRKDRENSQSVDRQRSRSPEPSKNKEPQSHRTTKEPGNITVAELFESQQ